MGLIKRAAEIWKNFNTIDIPASLVATPQKPDIIAWGTALEGAAFPTASVWTAAGDVTVNSTDALIVVNKAAGQNTNVPLPKSALRDLGLKVKDGKGDADAHPIMVRPDRSQPITVTIAAPGVFTWVGHGLLANAALALLTTGALPTGLLPDTLYYVVGASITANTFQVSAAPGGAAINTTGAQNGNHFVGTEMIDNLPVVPLATRFAACELAINPAGGYWLLNFG